MGNLETEMAEDRRLEPFLFFRNNALDIVKLLAGDDENLQQAGRNLVFVAFEKWGWALVNNMKEG